MRRLNPIHHRCQDSLVLVLLILAACGYEPYEPVKPPRSLSAKVPEMPRIPSTEYRGDAVGFSSESRILPALSAAGRSALLRLANAEMMFTSAHIGVAGSLSPHAAAFRALLLESKAREAFLELSASSRPEAQLYGLAGLYLVDNPEFRRRAQQARASGQQAWTLEGCIGGQSDLAAIIGTGRERSFHLWNGSWSRDLAGLAQGGQRLEAPP